MENLIETYHRLIQEASSVYQRQFYRQFSFDHRMVGIVGARGVGKTTFLLHYLKREYENTDKALYVSADHLFFTKNSLLALADKFYKEYAGQLLCIDEIHRYANWNQELKNIYDAYPKLKILFSGSSTLDLVKGKYDLSRRAILKRMHGFSFREYLEVHHQKQFPVLTLAEICKQTALTESIAQTPKLLGHLKTYHQSGYYPLLLSEISSREAYSQALLGMIDKTIYEDIASYFSLKTHNLEAFRRILYFIATAKPGGINVNKLASDLGKDHATVSGYLEMLRDSGLLHYLLRDARGHALIRTPEKIYFNNANLHYAVNYKLGIPVEIGTVRELFVITHLKDAGFELFFPDKGDVQCQEYIYEIGGKSKRLKQLASIPEGQGYSVKDDVLLGTKRSIPLYLFGFLI